MRYHRLLIYKKRLVKISLPLMFECTQSNAVKMLWN